MSHLSDNDLLRLMNQGELPRAMAKRFGLQVSTELDAINSSIIRLHNDGAWNLLRLVEQGEIQALDGSDFFMACHFFCNLFPDIETDELRLLDAIEALVARGGDDYAANTPNAALKAWCAKYLSRAHRIIQAAQIGDQRAQRNLTFALEALGVIEEARSLLTSANRAVRLAAITAIGRTADPDASSRRKTLDAFYKLSDRTDGHLQAGLLYSTVFLFSQEAQKIGESELALLQLLTEEPDEQVNSGLLSLSAVRMDFWPIILVACRHYHLPIPPGFWIDSLIPEAPGGGEASIEVSNVGLGPCSIDNTFS